MPVILQLPADPTDLVIQGEELRIEALGFALSDPFPLAIAAGRISVTTAPLVAGYQTFAPTLEGLAPYSRMRSQLTGSMVANNACICTPCGAVLPFVAELGVTDRFVEATNRWTISGVTRDSAGAALGNCAVAMYETGRIAIDASVGGEQVAAQTISDGSGNYSVEVHANTAYQGTAYKVGSPDVAGVTRNDLTPVHSG